MKPIHVKRLRKLAAHLRKGKLGHKKFYFGMWNTDKALCQLTKNGCGFAGCAIGECPIAFPRQWKWLNGRPVLRGRRALRSSRMACASEIDGSLFFGLGGGLFNHLFVPCTQQPEVFGGKSLESNARRTEVAANIGAFLKKCA